MADHSAGDPLAWRHAVVLYSAQTTYGTPVTPATAIGLARVRHTKRSSNQSFYGPGSPNRVAVKGGSTYTEWEIQWDAVLPSVKTLLEKSERASGVLPLITLGFGYVDDDSPANKSADQIQDCKVTDLSLSLDVSGGHVVLSGSMSGVGGEVTVITSLNIPSAPTDEPWASYEAVLTYDGNAFPCRSFDFTFANTVTRDHVIPGAAPSSFLRGHSYLTEHNQEITGSFSRYKTAGIAVQGDTVAQENIVLTLTEGISTTAITFTFTACDVDDEEQVAGPDGMFWSYAFTASTLAIT